MTYNMLCKFTPLSVTMFVMSASPPLPWFNSVASEQLELVDGARLDLRVLVTKGTDETPRIRSTHLAIEFISSSRSESRSLIKVRTHIRLVAASDLSNPK